MKYLIVLVVLLGLSMPVLAADKEICVTITETDWKVLQVIMLDPEAWLQNAIDARARKGMEALIMLATPYNPSKLSWKEKKDIIDGMLFEDPSDERQRKPLHKRIIK